MNQPEQITLTLTQGSSDKVYKAALTEDSEGWIVNFAYGRRNKPLRHGTKTAQPVDYTKAKKAYDALVRSKMAKGYTEDESGTPFAGSEKAGEQTSWFPQLLNAVTTEELLQTYRDWDGDMFLQTKHDGDRRGILWDQGEITPANRKGLVTTVSDSILKDLNKFCDSHVPSLFYDTEDMGDYLVIFDLLVKEHPLQPFRKRARRLKLLRAVLTDLELNHLKVDVPIPVISETDLVRLIDTAKHNNEEGVVARRGSSIYTPGKPNSGGEALKLKFWESCTCRVQSNHPTKRSIGLELLDNTEWVPVGNCTIPPNSAIPAVSNLVEIKYLYAYRGGSIYQPQYKGIRTDLDETAADINQLKFKE